MSGVEISQKKQTDSNNQKLDWERSSYQTSSTTQ